MDYKDAREIQASIQDEKKSEPHVDLPEAANGAIRASDPSEADGPSERTGLSGTHMAIEDGQGSASKVRIGLTSATFHTEFCFC